MKCQFCASTIPDETAICLKCGGAQNLDDIIPPPSPYYEAVIPPEPPKVETKPEIKPEPLAEPQIIKDPQAIAAALQKTRSDPATMALIGLIIGIAGVPLGLALVGCSLPVNAVGIFLSWLGLKSKKRGMAITGLVLNIGTILLIILFYVLVAIFAIIGISSSN